MQMNSLVLIDNSKHWKYLPKQASKLLFAYKILIKHSIDITVLEDGSVASFVTLVGHEKWYVFLIGSQESHLHFQERRQEKFGKSI